MFTPDPEQVTVRVSNKILYVGTATAYPLAGIVRVQAAKFVARNGWAIRTILLNLVLFLTLYETLKGLASVITALDQVAGLMLFALLAVFVVRCWEPIRIVLTSPPPNYVLYIDTAGGMGTRIANPDAELLRKIASMILDAIDDPTANWQMSVVSYHIGDNIVQTGPSSIAKVTA